MFLQGKHVALLSSKLTAPFLLLNYTEGVPSLRFERGAWVTLESATFSFLDG
jgi:hypothetical protein